MFISCNGDDVGQTVGSTIAQDDAEGLSTLSSNLNNAQAGIGDWIAQQGGKVISNSGDDGIYELQNIEGLEALMQQYSSNTGHTLTIGIGETISQAVKAMMYGKLNGKNQITQFSEEIENLLDGTQSPEGGVDSQQDDSGMKMQQETTDSNDSSMEGLDPAVNNEPNNSQEQITMAPPAVAPQDPSQAPQNPAAPAMTPAQPNPVPPIGQPAAPAANSAPEAESQAAPDAEAPQQTPAAPAMGAATGAIPNETQAAPVPGQPDLSSAPPAPAQPEANAQPGMEEQKTATPSPQEGQEAPKSDSPFGEKKDGEQTVPGEEDEDFDWDADELVSEEGDENGQEQQVPGQPQEGGESLDQAINDGQDQPGDESVDLNVLRQEIAQNLLSFKENAQFFKQQKTQNPKLYAATIAMLRNMIDMAKQLGLTPGIDADALGSGQPMQGGDSDMSIDADMNSESDDDSEDMPLLEESDDEESSDKPSFGKKDDKEPKDSSESKEPKKEESDLGKQKGEQK